MSDLIERLRGFLAAYRQCRGDGEMHSFYGGGLNGELHTRDLQEAADQLEAQQAEIARLRVALAGRCLGEDRYRSAASKALHILRHCPDKQEKAEAILSAALEQKP